MWWYIVCGRVYVVLWRRDQGAIGKEVPGVRVGCMAVSRVIMFI